VLSSLGLLVFVLVLYGIPLQKLLRSAWATMGRAAFVYHLVPPDARRVFRRPVAERAWMFRTFVGLGVLYVVGLAAEHVSLYMGADMAWPLVIGEVYFLIIIFTLGWLYRPRKFSPYFFMRALRGGPGRQPGEETRMPPIFEAVRKNAGLRAVAPSPDAGAEEEKGSGGGGRKRVSLSSLYRSHRSRSHRSRSRSQSRVRDVDIISTGSVELAPMGPSAPSPDPNADAFCQAADPDAELTPLTDGDLDDDGDYGATGATAGDGDDVDDGDFPADHDPRAVSLFLPYTVEEYFESSLSQQALAVENPDGTIEVLVKKTHPRREE